MIFDPSIKGLGYAPDEEEENVDEYDELTEDIAMERYYEEKYNN